MHLLEEARVLHFQRKRMSTVRGRRGGAADGRNHHHRPPVLFNLTAAASMASASSTNSGGGCCSPYHLEDGHYWNRACRRSVRAEPDAVVSHSGHAVFRLAIENKNGTINVPTVIGMTDQFTWWLT